MKPQHNTMATFWDKVKFTKKPFKEGEADSSTEAAVKLTAKKAPVKKATKASTEKSQKKESDRPATQFSHVLVRPHLSEKAVKMTEKGTYVFEVRVGATAPEVKNAVKAIYGITPIAVRMMNVRSRNVRFGRMQGKTRSSKKALVTLPEGKKLDIYG